MCISIYTYTINAENYLNISQKEEKSCQLKIDLQILYFLLKKVPFLSSFGSHFDYKCVSINSCTTCKFLLKDEIFIMSGAWDKEKI